MSCKVEKSLLDGTITCPANKSYSHRALFIATLTDGQSEIKNFLFSKDTLATLSACKEFGATINQNQTSLTVQGVENCNFSDLKIDAQNSGTTIRIAAAIASLSNNITHLTGDESLLKRPMQPLLNALESLGATCTSSDGKPPISVKGKIKGGTLSIPGNISSQFISAILIIGPKTELGIKLELEGEVVSKPYIDATIAAMETFGITVKTLKPYRQYLVLPQDYKPSGFEIPSDFSSLALLLSCAVLVGNNLKIKVAIGDLPQGDRLFIEFLKRLGIEIIHDQGFFSINIPKTIKGGRFDLSNNPDLLPPLSILSLKSIEPIEIFNVKHARYKESDRIKILSSELKKIGLSIEEKEDGMILERKNSISGGVELNSYNDHRLFMTFCIVGMLVGDCKVTNPESVDVSFPGFIKEISQVGGKITL